MASAVDETSESSASPLARISDAVRQGVDRYRALASAPEARRLLGAASLSYIGDRFNTIALIALSYQLGGGVLGVGGMLALSALPRLIVQGPAGVLVDRYPGKRLLVITQILMGITAAAFALLAAVPSLWLLYGLTFMMGILRTVDMPAFEVRLMALTPSAQRGTANAVHMLAMTAGELIGPLIGGLVLALTGAVPLFVLNGLSYVVVAAAVASLPERVAGSEPETVENEESATPKLGYLALLRRPDVALYIAYITASCVLLLGSLAMFVERAIDLGLGEGGVGLFYTILGVGTLVGGFAAGGSDHRTRRALTITAVAAALGAVGIILFGFADGLALAILALVIVGLTGDVEEIAALTWFQHHLPTAVYGRFFSLFLMATGAGGLVGALLGPALAQALGTGPAFTIMGIPVVILAIAFGIREGRRTDTAVVTVIAPAVEPEVVGHGLFGVPSQSDLLPDEAPGGPLMAPRLRRLV